MSATPETARQTSVVDNLGDNTLYRAIQDITGEGRELWIASAFFSLNALDLVGQHLHEFEKVRLLFGSDASATHRNRLLAAVREVSDKDLLKQRDTDPLLGGLKHAAELIREGKLEARVYTKDKFHAKAYLSIRDGRPPCEGIVGSGNFTRQGLTENIELNVHLGRSEAQELRDWYEERWNEAEHDVVTDEIKEEIERQVKLYDPYTIYLRALLTWGDWVQGREKLPEIGILGQLDPHQEDAYRQSLKVLERESGVMVCDGVGLGKSFVALAIMEHFLARGKRVFLIAPQAIIKTSWETYLKDYLGRYSRGYNSVEVEPMTWFGFDPAKGDGIDRMEDIQEYCRQAEVVVIDESHNFRKTDSRRYANLLKMLQEGPLGKKLVVLLTATPINTEYRDLSAQFRLITQESGKLGGIPIERYTKAATTLDSAHLRNKSGQIELEFSGDYNLSGLLKQGMEAVAIQRSRKTCKLLAERKGVELRFPERERITTIEYALSPLFVDLVGRTKTAFEDLAKFLQNYRKEVVRASKIQDPSKRQIHVTMPKHGLRFSAYLPDRYRRQPDENLREANVESLLALLVFTNVMKQLESSPAAFQGIIQALGAGLCARLKHVAREGHLNEAEVDLLISSHSAWIGCDPRAVQEEEEEDEDGESVEAEGGEMDVWLERSLRVNNVRKGLAGFGPDTHDVAKWRKHIEGDLAELQGIHELTVQARRVGSDEKLEAIEAAIADQRAKGRKVLVFTQSRRTADYVEKAFKQKFIEGVARMDAGIEGDRRKRILHAFSPKYNPMKQAPLNLEPVDILVSTDVLSEGVNLQEAGCIISYDIHWNPVRLIQRIGRVDRRLREDDPGHKFAVMNVVPPKEIEDIIDLVGTVEDRKRKIIRVLGLDQAFLSAKDPGDTLIEFNVQVEGTVTSKDEALAAYDHLVAQLPTELDRAEAAPNGAFGVWTGAPGDGLFAMYVLRFKETASDTDRARFGKLVGHPVMVLEQDGKLITDAAEVLGTLAATHPGEKSGVAGCAEFAPVLKSLKTHARQGLRDFDLTQGCRLELICWMELRR